MHQILKQTISDDQTCKQRLMWKKGKLKETPKLYYLPSCELHLKKCGQCGHMYPGKPLWYCSVETEI